MVLVKILHLDNKHSCLLMVYNLKSVLDFILSFLFNAKFLSKLQDALNEFSFAAHALCKCGQSFPILQGPSLAPYHGCQEKNWNYAFICSMSILQDHQ